MIEAIVFDMDGLLIDSEPVWQTARVDAFGADRLRWTDADQHLIQGSSTEFWANYIAERLDHALSVDEVIERVVANMEAHYRAHVPLLPGAREVAQLAHAHFPIGLASGSPYRLIHAALDGAGWRGWMKEILSSDDLARGKPAPDVYLEIARRLGVAPEQIAIFEDSGNGILAGHAAGVKVIAVPSAYHGPAPDALAKADLVIESLADFRLEMLEPF